jgi:voltage-gated potassium channel
VWLALTILAAIIVLGTIGYVVLGLSLLDALYQTVTTVSTVGFREVGEVDADWQIFTIALVLLGVGATLYTFGVLVDAIVDGRLMELFGRRRMERQLASVADHVVVCGYGRVGSTIAAHVAASGTTVVVVDQSAERIQGAPYLTVEGDATEEVVLRRAGIERARSLVATLTTDPDNLYVVLTARSLNPKLFLVGRARSESAETSLLRAGADRVVNVQRIGGSRMAALVEQPHVADFLDIVMHDGTLEFRLAEVAVPTGSPLAGQSLRDAHIRDQTGALVLAMRDADGSFHTNPPPDTVIVDGNVLIAIGTVGQLSALSAAAAGGRDR